MNRARTVTIILCVALLVSCDGFFGANVFTALEPSDSLTVTDLLHQDSLSELADELRDDSTYQSLDETEVTATETFLLDTIDSSEDDRMKATAADALASLYRHTTSAGKAVASVAPLITTVLAASPEDLGTETLLEAVLPEEALASRASFDELIDSFFDLDRAYDAMNDALGTEETSVANAGMAFQGALVAYMVTEAVDAIDINGNGIADDTLSDRLTVLYNAVSGGDSSELEAALDDFAPDVLLDSATEDGSGIEHIVSEAGFAQLLHSLTDSESGNQT